MIASTPCVLIINTIEKSVIISSKWTLEETYLLVPKIANAPVIQTQITNHIHIVSQHLLRNWLVACSVSSQRLFKQMLTHSARNNFTALSRHAKIGSNLSLSPCDLSPRLGQTSISMKLSSVSLSHFSHFSTNFFV